MLAQFAASQVYIFLLILSRVGSMMMVMPGLGETYVSPRIRLSLALMFSLLLVPVVGKALPPVPASVFGLGALIIQEIMTGVAIGFVVTVLTSAMHTAGMVISIQTGLSSVVIFDPNQATQGSEIGNFFGLMAVTILFALNLHHVMLQGAVESYKLFVPGHHFPMGDFTSLVVTTVSKTFLMAIKLSAPLIIVGLLVYIASGVLARLIPIIPVFFIIQAPQILVGLFIVMLSLSGMMIWYFDFFEDMLRTIF